VSSYIQFTAVLIEDIKHASHSDRVDSPT